jgi:hypothetical protein
LGAVTIVKGAATFSATSESADGTQAFATANSFADISGADNVVTKTKTSSYPDLDGGDSTWSETSTTHVIAIDIEGITLPKTLNVLEGKAYSLTSTPPDKASNQHFDPPDLDGNVAMVDMDVQVVGDDTYASVDTSVLAVEDTLSTVNALITAGLA